MIKKNSTEGMKLLIGGEEVTQDFVEMAIKEYYQKIDSLEFKKELDHFANFMNSVPKKSNNNFKYYKLSFSPYTIFKINNENFTAYKFDEVKKNWIEFPTFFVDLEYGNIRAGEIIFDDRYPIVSDLDLSSGRQR